MDANIDIPIENSVFCIVLAAIQKEADLLVEAVQDKKRRWKNALPGGDYVNGLLNSDHPDRIQAVLRMQLDTFCALRDWLLGNTHLKTSRNITVEEKLMIFLHITTRPASNRDTQERFSRSGDTISQYLNTLSLSLYKANIYSCFHEVLDALLVLYPHFTSLPDADTPLATRILDNPKYYPYFNNCLGALDGTHISIHVPLEEQSRYRNQKGTLSQNVLAVCNFDMQFVFVLPG